MAVVLSSWPWLPNNLRIPQQHTAATTGTEIVSGARTHLYPTCMHIRLGARKNQVHDLAEATYIRVVWPLLIYSIYRSRAPTTSNNRKLMNSKNDQAFQRVPYRRIDISWPIATWVEAKNWNVCLESIKWSNQSINQSTNQSINKWIQMYVCMYVCMYVLSIYLSICMYINS